MTVNNIDLVIRDWKIKIFRIIESKHIEEHAKDSQIALLQHLSRMIRGYILSSECREDYQLEMCVVTGNYPYEKISIWDLIENIEYEVIGKQKVIDWLELK